DSHNGDQIAFDERLQGQTITLTSGELALTQSLDIQGLGADQLAVSGNHQSRVFDISGGVTVMIAGLTITNGMAVGWPGEGGGILNESSQLALTRVVLSHNEAIGAPNQTGRGGAVANVRGAALGVTDSSFTGNRAAGGDGNGEGNGGAIFNN